MDERDFELDFDDLGGDPFEEETQAEEAGPGCETFYWALKYALERTNFEPPPGNPFG